MNSAFEATCPHCNIAHAGWRTSDGSSLASFGHAGSTGASTVQCANCDEWATHYSSARRATSLTLLVLFLFVLVMGIGAGAWFVSRGGIGLSGYSLIGVALLFPTALVPSTVLSIVNMSRGELIACDPPSGAGARQQA